MTRISKYETSRVIIEEKIVGKRFPTEFMTKRSIPPVGIHFNKLVQNSDIKNHVGLHNKESKLKDANVMQSKHCHINITATKLYTQINFPIFK